MMMMMIIIITTPSLFFKINLVVAQIIKNSLPLIEPDVFLLCSQKLVINAVHSLLKVFHHLTIVFKYQYYHSIYK
jgi:hypothetical protein